MKGKLFIGADHAGFSLKQEIYTYLEEACIAVEDLGSHELILDDDYPDIARAVAEKVMETGGRGILICDTGIGMCMAAGKVSGIRAVNAWNRHTAERSRQHNNANVLCLGAEYVTSKEAQEIIRTWLDTDFSGEDRHVRRIQKITEIENR